MADDTRQAVPAAPKEDLSREALTVNPQNKAFSGSQWDDGKAKPYKPPTSANVMEGGTQHTAGGQIPEVTLWNAINHGKPITEVHRQPCTRDAFMVGLGSGFALGGARVVMRAPVWNACNWAVWGGIPASLVMYSYCQYRRQAEKAGMTRAVEILHRKELEKQARAQRQEKLREERREAKDREQDAKLAEMKAKADGRPWWKVW